MIVVADTSPLNYLIRSNSLWVLGELFGEVLVPEAVHAELLHPNAPVEVRTFALCPPAWLKFIEVTEEVPGLPPALGAGECEAISLAWKFNADVLLIDDLAGRNQARLRNLPARGTLAVLLQAALRGLLDLRVAYEELTRLGFRSSTALERAVFRLYESRKEG